MTALRRSQITKFFQSIAGCQLELRSYGECVLAKYKDINKDDCAKEFLRYQKCVLSNFKR